MTPLARSGANKRQRLMMVPDFGAAHTAEKFLRPNRASAVRHEYELSVVIKDVDHFYAGSARNGEFNSQ